MNRSKLAEKYLKVKLPQAYKDFIDKIGYLVKGNYEIFGLSDDMQNLNTIPCVIGATKLYKKDYALITDEDIVISYDPLLNNPIVLNTKNGKVYLIDFEKRRLLAENFNEFLRKIETKIL